MLKVLYSDRARQGTSKVRKIVSAASVKGHIYLVSINLFVFQFRFLRVTCTILPAKSDSDVMFCLPSYQGLTIDISLVY